jgi:hypothetical protein
LNHATILKFSLAASEFAHKAAELNEMGKPTSPDVFRQSKNAFANRNLWYEFEMYKIKLDIETDLVELQLEGFWTESEFEQFTAEQHSALKKLKCLVGKHILLCDLTKLNVVAQDVGDRIGADLNSQGLRDAEWLAIVISSALLKLQMQRLLTRSNAQIFDDITSAREWLLTSSGRQPAS